MIMSCNILKMSRGVENINIVPQSVLYRWVNRNAGKSKSLPKNAGVNAAGY